MDDAGLNMKPPQTTVSPENSTDWALSSHLCKKPQRPSPQVTSGKDMAPSIRWGYHRKRGPDAATLGLSLSTSGYLGLCAKHRHFLQCSQWPGCSRTKVGLRRRWPGLYTLARHLLAAGPVAALGHRSDLSVLVCKRGG